MKRSSLILLFKFTVVFTFYRSLYVLDFVFFFLLESFSGYTGVAANCRFSHRFFLRRISYCIAYYTENFEFSLFCSLHNAAKISAKDRNVTLNINIRIKLKPYISKSAKMWPYFHEWQKRNSNSNEANCSVNQNFSELSGKIFWTNKNSN